LADLGGVAGLEALDSGSEAELGGVLVGILDTVVKFEESKLVFEEEGLGKMVDFILKEVFFARESSELSDIPS